MKSSKRETMMIHHRQEQQRGEGVWKWLSGEQKINRVYCSGSSIAPPLVGENTKQEIEIQRENKSKTHKRSGWETAFPYNQQKTRDNRESMLKEMEWASCIKWFHIFSFRLHRAIWCFHLKYGGAIEFCQIASHLLWGECSQVQLQRYDVPSPQSAPTPQKV